MSLPLRTSNRTKKPKQNESTGIVGKSVDEDNVLEFKNFINDKSETTLNKILKQTVMEYENIEYFNMLLCLGRAHGNEGEAARLYAEEFPRHRHPDRYSEPFKDDEKADKNAKIDVVDADNYVGQSESVEHDEKTDNNNKIDVVGVCNSDGQHEPVKHNKKTDDDAKLMSLMLIIVVVSLNQTVTIQCDGYTNIKQEGIYNFIVTTPQPIFYDTFESGAVSQNAEFIAKELIKRIDNIGISKFKDIQVKHNGNSAETLKIPAKTRFCSTIICLDSILCNKQNHRELSICVEPDVEKAFTKNTRMDYPEELSTKSTKQIILDDDFWLTLIKTINLVKPITDWTTK
ncbi:hypothetical protein HCN44_003368 [Aphidius gifuensis]|uniref:Uncharacterized protein n=1 Tax=Aphidius gifuensis TaxID=684658 RepID=A0A835CUF6_APHGI|nr:hypothetical protein HCN44_003368 [Aphidius gifuensis]